MRQGTKRPIQAYLLHVPWIAMAIFWSTTTSSEIGRWLLLIATAAGAVSFIYMIVKRNYVEVADNKLIINDGVFRTRTIDLAKVEKFEIEPGPFTASKIILKDKTTIKYSDSQTNNKKLKEFMDQYNIPVE